MKVRRVYIKKAGGEIASEACFAAWRGFSHLGYPLDFFEWDELAGRMLRLDRTTLVVGGAVAVRMALKQINVAAPSPLNVPVPLLLYAGRRLWDTRLGDLRRQCEFPLFVKPLTETKSFAGSVISQNSDLGRLAHLDDEIMLQASEVVDFVSEWRYFVHRHAIVGLAHYRGDWSRTPDPSIVRRAVEEYHEAPAAFCLDFGVTPTNRTLLVEANDAFALGPHGLDAVTYAKMLEDRWVEITTSRT